jgi:hypothetical protein
MTSSTAPHCSFLFNHQLRRITMKLKRKLAIVAAATVALVGAGGGAAFAVWSSSGTGTGAGGALTAQSLVVTAVTPDGSGSSLYPGGPAGWVYFTVQNPNPYAVTLTAISWGTPTSTNPSACASSNISLDAGAPTTLDIPVAANSTSGAIQINGVLDLAHSAPNGCQGAAFDVPVTVTGTQQ